MNYYQITPDLDSESEDDHDHDQQPPDLHQAVQMCLAKDTLADLRREYTKNTSSTPADAASMPKKEERVVMRGLTSRNSYGRRASQRFSKILEGVSSLVSLAQPSSTDKKCDEEEEEESGSASLPYWVEASNNVSKEGIKEDGDVESGYCSIADSINADSARHMEADAVNEKISQIFESMHLEQLESAQPICKDVKLRKVPTREGAKQRRKTVSGYFQDWASWMGSMETRTKDTEHAMTIKDEEIRKNQNLSRKSSLGSCDSFERSDQSSVDHLWNTWDTILIEWNKGGKKKIPAVKELVRQGIPQHLRGISWQMLCGAHNSLEKTKYLDYLKTESACEKAIHRDIARTYPEHDFFKKKDGVGQEALFNVMKAYSIHDREVGYCQGSAFIVGLLLMQMPEEECFAVVVKIMEDYAMREMFKPSMAELGLCMHQLDTLIQEQIPDLYVHFQSQAIHTNLYASRWFLTLFTSSLPLSLSYRVMDCFLSEGREVIFRIALALLILAKTELLLKDMEGVTKYFQNEMPVKFETDQDSVFSLAFTLNINPKKMKRIEKEYMTMKSKEAEDEMEIRRLRTENRLVRQKMEMLEQESSDLADRLIQDQVTRAQGEEQCFLMQEELTASAQAKQQAVEKMNEAHAKMKKMEEELENLKSEVRRSKKETELLLQEGKSKKNNEPVTKEVNKSQSIETSSCHDSANAEEEEEWKRINNETKENFQELRMKIRDLKNFWEIHLQKSCDHEVLKPTTSGPKKLFNSLLEGTSEVGRLEEELISSRLREVETLAEMNEWKTKAVEGEMKVKTCRHQLTRQDSIVLRLQEELNEFKRKSTDLKSQLRDSQIKFSNLEGKLKDEQLMGRIKDAENTQNVAELRHQISSLELKNQEIAALGNLNWCLEDNEDTKELQERVEFLTTEVNRLTKYSSNCNCKSPENVNSHSSTDST